jgi:Na+-driven multidrug efflux pump
MSIREDNAQNRTYSNLRTSLGVGMGILYISVGALVLYGRYYGTLELSATYAYILGGAMVLYGGFRIYRGLAGILRAKKDARPRRL